MVTTDVLMMGLIVLAYIIARELLTSCQPQADWMNFLPAPVAIGVGGLINAVWDLNNEAKRDDCRVQELEDRAKEAAHFGRAFGR